MNEEHQELNEEHQELSQKISVSLDASSDEESPVKGISLDSPRFAGDLGGIPFGFVPQVLTGIRMGFPFLVTSRRT